MVGVGDEAVGRGIREADDGDGRVQPPRREVERGVGRGRRDVRVAAGDPRGGPAAAGPGGQRVAGRHDRPRDALQALVPVDPGQRAVGRRGVLRGRLHGHAEAEVAEEAGGAVEEHDAVGVPRPDEHPLRGGVGEQVRVADDDRGVGAVARRVDRVGGGAHDLDVDPAVAEHLDEGAGAGLAGAVGVEVLLRRRGAGGEGDEEPAADDRDQPQDRGPGPPHDLPAVDSARGDGRRRRGRGHASAPTGVREGRAEASRSSRASTARAWSSVAERCP